MRNDEPDASDTMLQTLSVGIISAMCAHCGADVLLAVENYDFNTCITVDDGRDA